MKHHVSLSLPKHKLNNNDVYFSVKRNGSHFGDLAISKGSLVWFPNGRQLGHKISWAQFDEVAKTFPRRERRKR